MHDPKRQRARIRRALTVAGLISFAAGAMLLPAAASAPGAVAATTAAHASPHGKTASRVKPDSTTVTGPHLYDPATKKNFPDASSVTVSKTTDLVDQLIHVTWQNFTPSVTNGNPWYENEYDDYAVMALECRGTDPASPDDCYESSTHGLAEAAGPAGPPNATYAISTAQGTGELDILVETKLTNSLLNCSDTSACSLVLVPGQGGEPAQGSTPADCSDHDSDVLPGLSGTALAYNTFFDETGGCSWNDRIVVPLKFAPAPTGCPQRDTAFSISGSPMMEAAMQQWLTKLCAGANGMTIAYDSTTGEPTAVQFASEGLANVAFTTRPASADGVSTGSKKFVYAPIAISGASIAYWIDDNTTGQPLTGLKLNQRLMAKLLTTSYNPDIACTSPSDKNCDPGVDHNPFSIFKDKEFKSLNPDIVKNIQFFTSQPYVVPSVPYGLSDLTWTATNWIAQNKDASSFLNGNYDPWGMHVNTYYSGVQYPTDEFAPQDPTAPWADEFLPASPLSQVVTYQALSEDAGSYTQTQQPGGGIVLGKDPPEPVGDRALLALLDQGDAALNNFPVAALANAAGDYVTPTNASMAAAVKNMISDGDGTLQVNLANTDPAAYPLTMVVYAMVPINGLSHAKAEDIARFLRFAAGAGQDPGDLPGQLPSGYLPLTSSLRSQTLKLATEVADQTGDSHSGGGGSHHGGSGSNGTGSNGNSGSNGKPGSPSPATSPSTSPTPTTAPVSLVNATAQPASMTRFALPALLILGALAALGGASALAEAGEGGIAGQAQRLRRKTVAAAAWVRGKIPL